MADNNTDLFHMMYTCRSMRRLKPDPIADHLLRQIMDAAICAPSGGNRQGWSFVVVRNMVTRRRVHALFRRANGAMPEPRKAAVEREIRRMWREELPAGEAEFALYKRCEAQLGDMGREG